ncbi:hypothetical protein B484DRAFT_453338 [Ochromonadaceae sp. CCMP2298]|nr:hypothetical protein B484DRAFT_458529 [Ochromonadaceae sp. CCMP2298]KAJ1419679.1 hypothetical protein B484DRAFT_453338 [Ochromonadaceae sp. CCMP2298]|mmetsp:Transcript_16587/g.36769  ORF Transcript_16587/g.36769 Transcript_16587/m.36769 type:complete len:154 (-) Transcript_16587:198-659(-)
MGPKKAPAEEVPAPPTFGTGEFELPDNSIYVGDWSETAGVKTRQGKGTLTMGVEVYEGDWEADAMHGEGTYATASGCTYVGQFERNLYAGEGTYSFLDGASYSGSWQANKMHGTGVYTDSAGQVTQGTFRNGYYYTGDKVVPLRPTAPTAEQT